MKSKIAILVLMMILLLLLLPNLINRSASTGRPNYSWSAFSQGTVISIAPLIPCTLSTHINPVRLLVYSNNQEYGSLSVFAISQEQILSTLEYSTIIDTLNADGPLKTKSGTLLYTFTSAQGGGKPGIVRLYDISEMNNPQLQYTYIENVSCVSVGSGLSAENMALSNMNNAILRCGGAFEAIPRIVNLATSQVLGEYDRSSKFYSVEEHPNGNLVVLTDRRVYVDMIELQANENMAPEARFTYRRGPDIVELSPTLQFIRIIGEANPMYEGKYGYEDGEGYNIKMALIRNGTWLVISSYKDRERSIEELYDFPIHPHEHFFYGLWIIDYTTGNVIRRWHEQGGGLDSGVTDFDVNTAGTKIVAKAAPETFDLDEGGGGPGIPNPYVYIFDLQAMSVQKADWGLEGDSDIEIVDSVNRVYCTLPSQQALVWFPMP